MLKQRIKDFLDELIYDAIAYIPSRDFSDYQCRFCGAHTPTNNDFEVQHVPSCTIHRARELRDALIEELD